MSATVIPMYQLQAGREAFKRAASFGYGRTSCRLARRAGEAEANVWEDPAETAVRVVRMPHQSATDPTLDGAA